MRAADDRCGLRTRRGALVAAGAWTGMLAWRGPAAAAARSAGDLPPTRRTLEVATYDDLARAVEKVEPGDHIVLADGSYAGPGLVVNRSGTPERPIVIRAARKLQARVDVDLELSGDHLWLYGLSRLNKRLYVRGRSCRISRCRIAVRTIHGVRLMGGDHARVDHCDIFGTEDATIAYGIQAPTPRRHSHAEIDHNHFHDFPKPTKVYAQIRTNCISCGDGWQDGADEAFWNVHHNLVEHANGGDINLKASKCTITDNTLIGDEARISLRFGNEHTVLRNWIEGARGLTVSGGRHVIKWNLVSDHGENLQLSAGEQPWDAVDGDGMVQTAECLLVGNTARVVVGHRYKSRRGQTFEAVANTIRDNDGPIELRLETGTVVLDDAGEPPQTPTRLTSADVGPEA